MGLSKIYAFGGRCSPKQKGRKCSHGHLQRPQQQTGSHVLQPRLRTHPRNLQYRQLHTGRRLRIERTLVLEPNLLCVLSINKDFILYVFVARMDLGLAFEAVKKATEFINSNAKLFGGTTGSAKLEAMSRKLVECMGAFEEFLYTRDIALKEYMPLQPQPSSRRKGPDHDVLNKFTHISSDMDRKVILSSHLFSAGIEAIEGKRRARIL